MNRDEIIKLAREANPGVHMGKFPDDIALIFARFAALVAAAEREACTKVCDELELANLYGVKECAEAIRARGNT